MGKRIAVLVEARARGEKFYFTGKPCRNGHVANRRTSDRGCIECRPSIEKRSYEKHRRERIQKTQRWKKENPERAAAIDKAARDSGRAAAAVRRWTAKNRDAINAYRRDAVESDVGFRLRINIAGRINQAIRFVWGHKSARTLDLIGCSIEDLRVHLERQFKPGMSWSNYGYGEDKWHIDHIKPCASFDLTEPDQQRACFHFSNLQPLWQADNLRKGAKANFPHV